MFLQTVQAWRRSAFALVQCLLGPTERRQDHFPMEPTNEVSLHTRLQEPTQAWHGESN